MNITTIVTQMMILLLIMIVGFVGAKKNVFNDEVNVYASNILLKIGIPGLIISSVKDSSPLTGSELLNILVVFSIFTIFTGIVSKIIVEVLHIQENKALWQFIKQSKNTRDFSHEMNQIDRCYINNSVINDKYSALNTYICYNIDEGKTYGSC